MMVVGAPFAGVSLPADTPFFLPSSSEADDEESEEDEEEDEELSLSLSLLLLLLLLLLSFPFLTGFSLSFSCFFSTEIRSLSPGVSLFPFSATGLSRSGLLSAPPSLSGRLSSERLSSEERRGGCGAEVDCRSDLSLFPSLSLPLSRSLSLFKSLSLSLALSSCSLSFSLLPSCSLSLSFWRPLVRGKRGAGDDDDS